VWSGLDFASRCRSALLFAGVVAAAAGCASPPLPAPAGLSRAVWVTRFDWRSEADIESAISRAAELGFGAVFFQVRGNGTVLYRSEHEVWSDAFGFKDPGFDPLAVAVRAALVSGVQLHAWLNLMPGWSGDRPPDDVDQLYHAHAGWFLRDASGEREPLAKQRYAGLNPCLPEVRAYLADLCAEVARVEGLAGLHLDYVRLTSGDEPGGIDRFPDDALTRTRFAIDKGLEASTSPAAYRAWKVACVTDLVEQVRARVRGEPLLLSAAVLADPGRALASAQDWPDWARRGLVDVVVPMAYATDDGTFKRLVRLDRAAAGTCALVVGVGLFKHDDPLQTVRQMELAQQLGARGVALFSFGELVKPERAEFELELRRWLRG